MIDAHLEPDCFPDEELYCPECGEEAFLNTYTQIECTHCEACFDLPEPDCDLINERWEEDNDCRYG